jgi:hypothetical protein
MQSISRIPTLEDVSYQSMDLWFRLMVEANLHFHPDDSPKDIVRISDGAPTFTEDECLALDKTMSTLFENHGNDVYEAAYPHFIRFLEPFRH